MSIIDKIKKAIKSPSKIVLFLLNKFARIIPDKQFLQWKFRLVMGQKLDLKNPKTFNEKLQWLKLYDRKPEYTKMVDKIDAKEYVASIIGEEYIIPTLGVYESFDEIDFNKLPNQFVLKCSHDSGGIVICKDKSTLDIEAAKEKLEKGLRTNYYYQTREWPYKNVQPRIIAEKFMTDNGKDLEDYKIHTFNGIPKFILLCRDRFKEKMIDDFYSTDWELLDVRRPGHPNSPIPQNPPKELAEMLRLSEILSKEAPFLRVDFYTSNNRVYFGELTFFPASGMSKFEPEKWDEIFGNWLTIDITWRQGADIR